MDGKNIIYPDFVLNVFLIDPSQIPIWWRHRKFSIIFPEQFLPDEIGNELDSENS